MEVLLQISIVEYTEMAGFMMGVFDRWRRMCLPQWTFLVLADLEGAAECMVVSSSCYLRLSSTCRTSIDTREGAERGSKNEIC